MKTRVARTTLIIHTAAWALTAALLCGCQPAQKARQTASAEEDFGVRIDRNQNGAAAVAPTQRSADQKTSTAPRALAFEMTGAGKMSEPGTSPEQRIAASQAAIIEAFCKAVMEARRTKGQPDAGFSTDFGPRLKVSRTAVEGGFESRVTLVSRGVETTFIVRDGKLQHEPHDLHQVQQIFDATNGEFALLGTSMSPVKGECVATVAHYVPGEVNSALAGSVPNDQSDSATDPASAQ
jgi:outer membrane murein-binding lipoprotein Lpp